MANSPQAKKRARQNVKRYELQKAQKTVVRTLIKKFLEAVNQGKAPAALEAFKKATKALNQLSAKKIIHRRKTSRLTSRMNSKLKAITSKG